ncbi:transformer-2 protein homolog beta isoform X4 [Notolabrus celidotus]|uniref:transformer-2 protein homolog beta isoform X4 n=1 Tax=Notolabrus celidotus TaxID=1203425 RepID=UPI0014901C30|nr:transformer-2 protein homolog beta isoform X4 [Notolabrus celidotus]
MSDNDKDYSGREDRSASRTSASHFPERSPAGSKEGSHHSHSKSRSRSRSKPQANPDPNSCLGVFGLSLYTTERDLSEVFSKYGPLADVSIVYDQQSRCSRGFAFIYFEKRDDAKEYFADLFTVRQRIESTAWSWMVEGSGWTSPSQNDLTPQPLESTWDGPHMVVVATALVEVAQVVHDATRVTMAVDMTGGTTEVVLTAMMTGTTTDHTGDLLHCTTEGLTGLALGHY